MGIVEKQAIRNTIISYAGVALGYLNIVLLFPAFFTTEQFGLIQLLIGASVVFALLSQTGLVNIITRFFPFFKTEDKNHSGFLTWVTTITISGFIAISVLYILFRPLIVNAYIENSALFIEYFYFVIPLSFFTITFNILEVTARVVFRTVFTTLLREVGIRLLTTIGILLKIASVIDFNQFVYFYLFTYGFCSFLILIQLIISKEFKFKIDFLSINRTKVFEMLKYGGFTLISSASMMIGEKLDGLILGAMAGLSIVGVYYTYLYIATVIYMPTRSLNKITVPIIAGMWKENDIKGISEIYRKSSLVLMVLGTIIYLGIIVNEDNLMFFFGRKPAYADSFNIFLLLGLAFLIDTTLGLSSEIIYTSAKYKFDTLFNIILLVTSVAANLILIPIFGGVGAAIAILITFVIFNFLKWIFLKLSYKIQVVSYKHLIIIIIGVTTYLLNFIIPKIQNVFIDMAIRSIIVSVFYFSAVYIFRISDDINNKIKKYLRFHKL